MKLQSFILRDKNLLGDMILKQLDCLKGQVQALERAFSSEHGPLCLGVDREGRYVVIIFSIDEDDSLVVEALGQLGWIVRNRSLMERLYGQKAHLSSASPRIVLISPSFSRATQEAISYIETKIELYRFRALEVNQERVLLLEPVLRSERPPVEVAPHTSVSPPSNLPAVELSEAEMRFFEKSSRSSLSA